LKFGVWGLRFGARSRLLQRSGIVERKRVGVWLRVWGLKFGVWGLWFWGEK